MKSLLLPPQGDIKALPKGATVLDFAYAVHTEVGHHCVGARVNGKIAPLRQELKNGDTVEILTGQKQKPSKDWFSFVKTSRAKSKIRSVIRAEQRKRSQEIGREVLDRECKRHGIKLSRSWKTGQLGKVVEELGYKNPEEMLIALGYGKISTGRVINLLLPSEQRKGAQIQDQKQLEDSKKMPVSRQKRKSGILVQGMDDLLVRFGKCCNPIPGDEVVGVITRGRGVTVHTESCKRLTDSDPERRVEINWGAQKDEIHSANLRVRCEDRPGLLTNISKVLADENINISWLNVKGTDDGMATCSIRVGVQSLDQLSDVLRKIEKIRGVVIAERVYS